MDAPKCKLCGERHWSLCDIAVRAQLAKSVKANTTTKRGRPAIGNRAMTSKERKLRVRQGKTA